MSLYFEAFPTGGPNHPSKGLSRTCNVVRVKSNMAARLQFSEVLQQPIQHCKWDILKSAKNGDDIGWVSNFFRELEDAVAVFDRKYSDREGRFSKVQRLMPSRRIVARSLRNFHAKVILPLHTRPRLAYPWRGELKMDIPLEWFESISQDILQHTSFGQRYRETNTEIIFEISDLRKAKYLFGRMDLDGFEVDPADILKKHMSTSSNNLERSEVLASTDKPMELKFHKKKELLEVSFHYGYWNPSSIPQH